MEYTTEIDTNTIDDMELRYFTNNPEFPFCIQFGKHDEAMHMHAHTDFTELVIVLEGSATHYVEQCRYPISKGDVFVINGNKHHGFFNPHHFKVCNIMFNPEYFFRDAEDLKSLSGFHTLFFVNPSLPADQFESRLKLTGETFENVESLLRKMILEFTEKKSGYQSYVKAMFFQFCIDLSRTYSVYSIVPGDHVPGIARAAAYLEKHYEKDIKMEELAEIAGLSVRHFTRSFGVAYNMPPAKYLEKIRFNHAKLLIRASDRSLTDIAYSCGFSDNNYFSRRFKHNFGMSPSEYRSHR